MRYLFCILTYQTKNSKKHKILHSHINGTHHYRKDHFLHQIIYLQSFFPISFLHSVSLVLLSHYYFSPAHA